MLCEGKAIYKSTHVGLLPLSEAGFVYQLEVCIRCVIHCGKWAAGILRPFERPVATKASSSGEPVPMKKET